MDTETQTQIISIRELSTPDHLDSNFEDANIVDGVYAVARALNRVADAIVKLGINDTLQRSVISE